MGAFFNGVFPSSAPGDPSGWAVENAFPNLTFTDPMMMSEIPGMNQFLVVGKIGKIWRFPKSPTATMAQRIEVLNLTGVTQTSDDQGFYSLAFHPKFGQAGQVGEHYVYVCYSRQGIPGVDDDDHSYWTVSRFTWLPGSGTLDPASESILISQYDPHRFHNGGATFFGTDGFLYITAGDGGLGGDGLDNSQRIDVGLFGGILRIDVNNDPAKSHPIRRQPTEDPLWGTLAKPAGWPSSFSQGYGIPNDNPFLAVNGSKLEEFYAIGLRSPHSAHLDPVTGEIWVGDVGEANREELSRVSKGANCQWAYIEGTRNTSKTKPSPLTGTDLVPVYEYDHSEGASIIGGMRYRGTKWADFLDGKVIFGDHVRGRIWSLEPAAISGPPTVVEMVSSFDTGYKKGLCGFSTDSAGEIYIMNLAGSNNPNGKIMKLAVPALSADPPQFLSQTGVFTDLATLSTAPGVIPYEVPNPLWSDNAEKRRWIIVPNDGSFNSAAEDVVFSAEGNWNFPLGTVFVKHFEAPVDANNPSAVKRLETRFIVCTAAGGKYGFTYKWNAAGTDAELLNAGAEENYTYTNSGGGSEARTWSFPSRGDCLICHNDVSGQALGVRTAHLNSDLHYPSTGRTANQLATFNSLGMFDSTLGAAQLENYIEARPLDDETAPLEHRVRSYLDTNCSHCHQPGGQGAGFDARLGTPLDLQNLINGIPTRYEALGPDGRYIKPGDTSLSAVFARLSAVGNGDAMPPLAKNLAHAQGVAALQSYINGLVPAEFDSPPAPQARFVRLTSITGQNRYAAVGEFTILDGEAIPISHIGITATADLEAGAGSAASEASDGNPGSSSNFWQTPSLNPTNTTPNHPHWLKLDLGTVRDIGGFIYYPRPTSSNGRILQYQVHYSVDGTNWTLFDSGTWANTATPYQFKPGYNKRAARCQIAGPTTPLPGDFEVTVVFDMDTTEFSAADLQVTGGSVTDLRGAGYYYVAKIRPSSPNVTVQVPEDVVSPDGQGSLASSLLSVTAVPDVDPPSVPGDLTATPDMLYVTLQWSASTDNVAVSGYQILRDGVPIAIVSALSYTDTGLEEDTEYDYEVIAIDASDIPSAAAQITVSTLPDEIVPSVPGSLGGTPDLTSIALNWTASTDNIAVTGYQVHRNNVVIATVQTLGFTDTGLDSGTTYHYVVTAIDEAENISVGASLSLATLPDLILPSTPEDLAGTPQLQSIHLSWTASTDNVGVTGYEVRRNGLVVATVTGLTYHDTGLESGVTYNYEVVALDRPGNQSIAAELAIATLEDLQLPSTPENLQGIADVLSIQLTWEASTDNIAVNGYRIRRGEDVVATVQTLAYTDTGLASDTEYRYEVSALDEAGNASVPAVLTLSTLEDEEAPEPPETFIGTPDLQSVELEWTAADDNVGVIGYQILRDDSLIATVTELHFTDSGLETDTGYDYQLIALDAANNASSPVLLSVTTLADEEAPSVPTGLAATPHYEHVVLVWNESGDNVGVTRYEVLRNDVPVATVATPGYTDTGLVRGTPYTYKVKAIDAADNVSAAAELAVATRGFDDWLEDHGLAGQTAGDTDHGGLDNLTEYHLGMDPNDPLDDLGFRLTCALQPGNATITFPELVPAGNYYLHASSSLEGITLPANRIATVTRAQIQAMTPAERSAHTVEVPTASRAFFVLVFEPAGP